MTRFQHDLRLAHDLADLADQTSMARFEALDLRVERKADASEVTDADIAVEQQVRRGLARHRPHDAVHGEEGQDTGSGARRWVVDPIDGTANYLRGVPIWASLVALMVDQEVVCSVVSAPALGRRWWAARGEGAHTSAPGRRTRAIHVSDVDRVEDASLSYASLTDWLASDRSQAFRNLAARCWRTRAYGDFYSYVLLAEGHLDVATELELKLHDMAALDVIVREAGGRFGNLDGRPGPFGPGALATNGHLHSRVLEVLTPRDADHP